MNSLQGLRPQRPTIALYSTVTGNRIEDTVLDAEYWWQNVRQPVRFVTAMRQLIADGHKVFLEVGPHPVLSTSIKECMREAQLDGAAIATLCRTEPESDSFAKAIGALYTCGAEIDWSRLYPMASDEFLESLKAMDETARLDAVSELVKQFPAATR
jgi:acyl transferase domain-containing protein